MRSDLLSAPPSVRLPAATRSAPPLPRWKRSLDVVCCVAAAPLLGAAALLFWLWLALTAPGPLLFRQERVGHGGRRFLLYKFRTMRTDADTASHCTHFHDLVRGNRPMQKLDAARDARLVPGAWLLRASGLDELPQFVNVLRGEMSLVGPRPCIPYEYEHYSVWHRQRLDSLPGLTGLWQVSGKNRTTFDEMVRLDIEYGRTRSLARDLAILARTVPALCAQISDTRRSRRTPRADLAPFPNAAPPRSAFNLPAQPYRSP